MPRTELAASNDPTGDSAQADGDAHKAGSAQATGSPQSTSDAQAAGGQIYDLGYRNYDGPRLGRRSAVAALATLSLRNTYGLGRGTFPKILAFGLAAVAMLPAFVIMLVSILVGTDEAGVAQYDDFFEWVQTILVVFVAAMASDLVGSDRRNNILPLYFSRPIERNDYALAKMGALAIGLLPLTLLPQLLIFVGNWMGANDTSSWLGDNVGDLLPIFASSVLVCLQLATVGLAISMFTTRRAFALMAVLGGLLVVTIVAEIVVELSDSSWNAIAALLSPLSAIDAAVLVLFDVRYPGEAISDIVDDTPGLLWVAVPLIHAAIALSVALRRYQRTSL